MRNLLLAATALFPLGASAATYTIVAPGTTPAAGQFASMLALSQAQMSTPFLKPGDIVDMQAGVYNGDEGKFYNLGTPANPVTFMAVGGIVYMPSLNGASNGKGTLDFASSDVVVNGFVFGGLPSGSAGNEAGIRLGVNYGLVDANGYPYPFNLTVKNSGFIMKADGILADSCSPTLPNGGGYTPVGSKHVDAPCTISIDSSYFAGNGAGDGLEHGIYIDNIDHLTVTNSLFMGGFDGHLIKSRAFATDIENSRLIEGPFAVGNSLIDFPVGGNETVKNNVMEIGPYNYNGFINYNEEAWPPILNNPGATLVITGNTVIDDWSGGKNYTAEFLWDDSLDTSKVAPLTHVPAGSTVALTMTGNTFYGPKWTTTNLIDSGNSNGGGPGGAPTHPAVDGSNTIAAAGAPTPDTTPPIAWPPPGTPMQTLDVTANGFALPSGNASPAYYYPELVLWWNGLPLTPAPVTITADDTTGAVQHLTYQVPVIPGALQYLGGQSMGGGCCLGLYPTTITATAGSATITVNFPNHRQTTGHIWTIGWGNTTVGGITIPANYQAPITVVDANTFTFQAPSPATSTGTASTQVYTSGSNGIGMSLNWLTGSIGGGTAYTLSGGAPGLGGSIGGTNTATFPANALQPPVDTSPPVLAPPATLTLAAGTAAPLTLSATDPDNTAAQLTYKVTTAPKHGVVKDGGVPAMSWTQADLAAGRVAYAETGTVATTDSIGFSVSDPAGNSVSGTLPITVTAAAPPPPPTLSTPTALKLVAGTSAPIVLSATDPNATAAQLTYKVTTAPKHGTIKVSGVAATTWTQATVAAGLVTYTASGTVATTDSIGFSVSDPAGNSVSGILPVTVLAPAPVAPGAIILAPGVTLIPHANGVWGWK